MSEKESLLESERKIYRVSSTFTLGICVYLVYIGVHPLASFFIGCLFQAFSVGIARSFLSTTHH